MTAKEYLRQAFFLDRKIKAKERQLDYLQSHVIYTTPQFSDMPHASSSHKSAVEEATVKIMELEEWISKQIMDLIQLKREIAEVIKSVGNIEYETLLEMRYLSFMDWTEIATRMNYSERYTYKVHGRALELVRVPQ